MYFHPLVFITPALAITLYFAGYMVSRNIESASGKILLALASLLLCAPGFSLIFHFNFIGNAEYVEFRSIPYVELTSAAWGFLFGVASIKKNFSSPVAGGLYSAFFLVVMSALVMDPLYSAIMCPVRFAKFDFLGQWKDGVCLQSSGVTCVPASMATVLDHYGASCGPAGVDFRINAESRLARLSNTSDYGTEPWQALRCLRGEGLAAECVEADIENVPAPSIIVIYLGTTQHAVVYFGKKNGKYEFGDPLYGKVLLSLSEFLNRCEFKGMAFHVMPRKPF